MTSKQAKDFLVEQTARQAAIEHVPLSDLEKRMMYFTEGSDAVEDPVSLHEEFEGRYDSAEYENKISRLLKHACTRLRSEDSVEVKTWKRGCRSAPGGRSLHPGDGRRIAVGSDR